MGENGSPSFKVLHRINVLDILTWFVFNIYDDYYYYHHYLHCILQWSCFIHYFNMHIFNVIIKMRTMFICKNYLAILHT